MICEQSSTGILAGSQISEISHNSDEADPKSLEELLENAYEDEVVEEIMGLKARSLWKLSTTLTKRGILLSMGDLRVENGRLYVKTVPDNEALQLYLLQQHRNPPVQGHPGYKAMYQKIQADYFWFDMARHCKQYATNCSTCRRRKSYSVKKQDLLNPLPIPKRK